MHCLDMGNIESSKSKTFKTVVNDQVIKDKDFDYPMVSSAKAVATTPV